MPVYDVIVAGKRYHVEIPDPGASPLKISVDGEVFDVTIAGVETEVSPVELAPAPPPVASPGPLPAPPRVKVARPASPSGGAAADEITAPMPGTILSIAVQPGDACEAGTVLCVLEAMKMKNPIRATHTGVVKEVAVTPGQTVAYGDLLIRLG